ncbi:GntR family transcriptional regulator [Nakamurella sp. A5-74]|uniref:GntR family transcriptional regulator n=1 Tax=Nakamurella sp. A5-74 TaxID=3158264 RepID=A0AAU8DQB4_9ACTN
MTVPVSSPALRDAGSAGPTVEIDRGSIAPLYLQLKDVLLTQIRSGSIKPGEQLPGEHVLCTMHGVSRTVVRQALSDLELESVVERRKGKGTFVAHRRVAQSLVQHLGGLHDDIKAMGRTLRSDVRRQTIELADPQIADRLRVAVRTPVVVLERLRLVDGEPWVYATSHVPVALAPDLVTLDMSEQSLYEVLHHRYGLSLASSDRSVEAVQAGSELAAALGIDESDPILKLTSVSYDADGVPAETFVAHHRGDRSRFEVHLTRTDDAAVSTPMYLV